MIFTNSTKYLEFTILPGQRVVANHIANVIRKVKTLTMVSELRSFLGICYVFGRFVPNFARIVSPLPKRLKEIHSEFLRPLKEDKLHDLHTLKEKLISPLVISFPKHNGHYTLDNDTYDEKVGCVLLGDQKEVQTPGAIGNWARTLTK